MKKKIEAFILMMVLGCLFCGCSIEETNGTKISDLTYTIVEEKDLPEELRTQIEEKKAANFKMTYELDDDLYIVHGYGEQATGGYSIRIKELYLTSNAIVFDTELVGPRKGENASQSPSFPYIVVRTDYREENVVFD
ncbi:MAG: protease complex subunit PrcB family protein [Clostridiales bacterium]|nr:protease complex subunit PrcB family protein [Clostridiales bacterium]